VDAAMMEQIGTIYRDDRDIYLVIDADGEAYYFEPGAFHQGLTRYATRGCQISEIEKLMETLPENE
jgi:hypothetical protein